MFQCVAAPKAATATTETPKSCFDFDKTEWKPLILFASDEGWYSEDHNVYILVLEFFLCFFRSILLQPEKMSNTKMFYSKVIMAFMWQSGCLPFQKPKRYIVLSITLFVQCIVLQFCQHWWLRLFGHDFVHNTVLNYYWAKHHHHQQQQKLLIWPHHSRGRHCPHNHQRWINETYLIIDLW